MNNKIFIAVSVLLVGIMSVIFGFDAPAQVPDSVVMSDTPATSAPEKAPSKEEILASVEESLTMWENGEASAQMVIRQFEALLTHEDEEISAAAQEGIERITVETDSGRLFDDAEMQYSSGDYIGAIRSILNISPSYSGWDECSQLLISCKQQVNALVSAPETIEDYESSIALLDEYLELVDDEVMRNKRNDFSDALAEKAISLVVKWLPIAFENGNDLLAREKMHNASCMAGLAFNSAGLGLCHGIAHGIGGKLHLPHGRANAIVLPYIMQFNADLDHGRSNGYSVAAKKYQRLAKILDLPCSSVPVGVSQVLKTVETLNKALKIPSTLKKGGYDMALFQQEQDTIIDAALADVTTTTNPRKPSRTDIERLLKQIGG